LFTRGEHAYLFQPHTNYHALEFEKALSTRMAQKIVKHCADYSRLGDLSPHDLSERHRIGAARGSYN